MKRKLELFIWFYGRCENLNVFQKLHRSFEYGILDKTRLSHTPKETRSRYCDCSNPTDILGRCTDCHRYLKPTPKEGSKNVDMCGSVKENKSFTDCEHHFSLKEGSKK